METQDKGIEQVIKISGRQDLVKPLEASIFCVFLSIINQMNMDFNLWLTHLG